MNTSDWRCRSTTCQCRIFRCVVGRGARTIAACHGEPHVSWNALRGGAAHGWLSSCRSFDARDGVVQRKDGGGIAALLLEFDLVIEQGKGLVAMGRNGIVGVCR